MTQSNTNLDFEVVKIETGIRFKCFGTGTKTRICEKRSVLDFMKYSK
jgi:hypothetical protein